MDEYIILGAKHFKGSFNNDKNEVINYDFVRLYVAREISSSDGAGWEVSKDCKVKITDAPSVLGISSIKQLSDIVNRPCKLYFDIFGKLCRIDFS